jgi:hypothetical protein
MPGKHMEKACFPIPILLFICDVVFYRCSAQCPR